MTQPIHALKKVLHVGCGPKMPERFHPDFQTDDWQEVRLDIDPAMEPDIVASITAMPMVETGSMDALYSSHNLEHLFSHEVPIALGEFFRVLKPGGLALITIPDIYEAAKLIVEGKLETELYGSPIGPITPMDFFWGHQPSIAGGRHYMLHKTGFTAESLRRVLTEAGFETTQIWTDEELNLWAKAYKPA